MLEKKLT